MDIFPSWLGPLVSRGKFQDRPEITLSFGHLFNLSNFGDPDLAEFFKSFEQVVNSVKIENRKLLRIEFSRGKTSTWVTLHILKLLRIEFPQGKTSIRRHPEIITNCGFRMLLRMKYFLGITSIWATLGPRNWATWRSWAAFVASDDLGLKFSLEETQFWATPGFATLEAPWRLRLRLSSEWSIS